MGRRNQRPVHFEPLMMYEQLRFYARKFGLGCYNCLVVVGPPGRLKSTIIEGEAKNAHLISGNASPFEVFLEAQQHRDELLLIDDADGLYADSPGQRLLKQLTNPKTPKTVSWHTEAPVQKGMEKVFTTSSKVCIVDNAWNTHNEHIAALEDRSRLFLFAPPPSEVHLVMEHQSWFYDDEIYEFIGQNLTLFTDLSVRVYEKALEAKNAGEDWREFVLKKCVSEIDRVVILLEYEPAWQDKTSNEKAEEFLGVLAIRRGRVTSTIARS